MCDPDARMTARPDEDEPAQRDESAASRRADELEDGRLDPDEVEGEPAWWDEGSDDET